MKTTALNGKSREEVGKKDSKALRADGFVPCVIYGGEAPVHFAAEFKDLNKILSTPETFIFKITLEGKEFEAILQDSQFHPLTDALIHMDFLAVTADKPVAVSVPVTTTGASAGVLAGGKLQLNKRRIKIKGLIANLPDFIEVDITNIALGEAVKVQELAAEGFEFLEAGSDVVLAVKLTRGAIQAAADAAKAEELEAQ